MCSLGVVIPPYGKRRNLRAFFILKGDDEMIRVAILVDEGNYRKRANRLFGQKTAAERATELEEYCKKHLLQDKTGTYLYRIFYYDYPPCDKNIYHPFLQRNINLKKSDLYTWMNTFLNELKSTRKFALRMGRLSSNDTGYIIKPEKMKALCANKISFSDITEDNFRLDIK